MRRWKKATPTEAYDEAVRRIEQVRATGGTRLDLHDLPLGRIPPEIGELAGLEWLLLGFCTLGEQADVPPKEDWENSGRKQLSDLHPLQTLTKLQLLDLSWCEQITDMSPLGELTELTQLDLSHCTLIRHVSPLGNLTRLKQQGQRI